MTDQQDVDRFLWELERHLSHLDGDDRRRLLRKAEDRLHELAERIAAREGAQDLEWVHYVQATAELGPPEHLAAELTGKPLPDRERSHRRLWGVAIAVAVVTLAVVTVAFLSHGELEEVGRWSGEETGLTARETLIFNVSEEAESVFLEVQAAPTTANGTVAITVLDGSDNLVYEATGTLSEHLEAARYLQGAGGTWHVFLDFESFTGAWSVQARQELP